MEEKQWGSDVIVDLLRRLDFEYVTLVPGSSFRGLHDSIVNFRRDGAECPKMLLCLHEEHAVAIAHGFAKVTETPMLSILHSNVGLMHASMAIFNAFCDRSPVVILCGTGPLDAAQRRPWIDWVHSPQDVAYVVRPYVKWEDQPLSLRATLESVLRANMIARTAPYGPVFVAIDAPVQEQLFQEEMTAIDVSRFRAPIPPAADASSVKRALELLRTAKRPVVLAGRVSRGIKAWNDRIVLAEGLNARVVTDLRVSASFPTGHPLSVASSSLFLSAASKAVIREADVILNLDFLDLAGSLKQAGVVEKPSIVSASLDRYVHNGWSRDHQALCEADLDFVVDPDDFVTGLLNAMGAEPNAFPQNCGIVESRAAPVVASHAGRFEFTASDAELTLDSLGHIVAELRNDRPVSVLRTPIGGLGAMTLSHPLDYFGLDGGGGIGSGPGMIVGSALALRDRAADRLPVAILGDGDFLMGASALWTAVANAIPLLIFIADNRSFFNDELHQERVAIERDRDVKNRWIGQRIADPAVDIAAHARSLGALAFGPLSSLDELLGVLPAALEHVEGGGVAVLDLLIAVGDPGAGTYGTAAAAAITGLRTAVTSQASDA